MKNRGKGIKFSTAISREQGGMIGFIFVDNIDLSKGNLNDSNCTIEKVCIWAQEAIDIWEGYLKTTGRAIRPDKSFVYLISFYFQPNGAYVFDKIVSLDKTLSICNKFEDQEILKFVEANEGRDTLGIALAPDVNMKDELKLLNTKIER